MITELMMKTIMNIIIFGEHVKGSHYYSRDPINWTQDEDDCELDDLDENDDHFVNDDDHVKSSSKEVII